MSRVAVILLVLLLAACGVFLFLQLDTLKRVVGPNQRSELGAKRELAAAVVQALRTGDPAALQPYRPSAADVRALIEEGGTAMEQAIERVQVERDALADSIRALRARRDANLGWDRIRLDERDEANLVYLAPQGAPLGTLYVRIRCGRSIHDLEVTGCARAPRGWVVFGGVGYKLLVRAAGCEATEDG